jgi:hypothetical protein
MAEKITLPGSKSANISVTSDGSTVRSPEKSTMNDKNKVSQAVLKKTLWPT